MFSFRYELMLPDGKTVLEDIDVPESVGTELACVMHMRDCKLARCVRVTYHDHLRVAKSDENKDGDVNVEMHMAERSTKIGDALTETTNLLLKQAVYTPFKHWLAGLCVGFALACWLFH